MRLDRRGEVVTFFSFKGGTGRTMALANVAWILASRGKRVLVVDWDLDSPGLHKFYMPFLDAELYHSTPGVVDIISEYARAATHSEARAADWHLPYARVLPHAISLDWTFPAGGTLDIISAGRRGRSYSAVLSGFDWDNFSYRLGGGLLFAAMREDMKRNYDYTLIDSRTGLSDVAGICTVRFPDTVVNCFTLSTQSIEGAADVARTIDDLVDDREVHILPVPMRVEDAEQQKLANGRAMARQQFASYPSGLDPEAKRRYWGEVEIPYKPFYAYEETLAVFAEEPGMPTTLLSAYERLTGVLTHGEVSALGAVPDETRRRTAALFERRALNSPPDVFLSYAPEDRMWADWIASVLVRSGARVIAQGADFPAGADVSDEVGRSVAHAGCTMVLLSRAYVRSSQAAEVWRVLAAAESDGSRRPLVPFQVAEVPLVAPFNAWNAVDLVRLDETAAAEAVLRAVGMDGQPDPEAQEEGSAPAARFPGARPPVWSVPTRNAAFTGRSRLLQEMRDNLAAGSTLVQPQVLHGLGGVGKTQVVIEFAHRFMSDYDLVWWIPAQQSDLIAGSFADIAPELGIRRGESIDEAADAVREALRRGRPYERWLIIFDNAEDPDLLEAHLPTGGHVIITSRNPAWAQIARPIEVDAFTRQESVEHLTRRVQAIDRSEADKVAQTLGDLPLAVELASAWLAESGMPVSEYLQLLDSHLAGWLASDDVTSKDYPSTAAATWRVSIDRLRQDWPAAVRLLELCSCFGPEPISMSLLYSDETLNHLLPYDSALQEKLVLGRVIREIGRYALARVDQSRSSIQVHRLVQAVIRDSLTEDEIEATEHEVHRILASGRPRQGDIDDPANWTRYNELWPHLRPSRAQECTEEIVRGLLVERVRYLWRRGEYDEGLAFAQPLRALWTDTRGPDDRQVLYLRFHIANIARSQGDFRTALEIDEDVLARQTSAFGREYVHTLMTASALTADLSALGRFGEAISLARSTTDSFVAQYGEDHPLSLAAANNLALSYRISGDPFTALEIDRQTLRIREQVLTPDHPLTLSSAMNMGRDLREVGEYRESTMHLRSTLERFRHTLGNDFPDTLRAANSLSISLRKSGQHDEAYDVSSTLLEEYALNYRPDHPDRLACQLNVACDLSARSQVEAALSLAEETTQAYAALFGTDHQYTLVSANNRAVYLRQAGQVTQGREYSESTLARMEHTLGEDHPLTLACAMNVGNACADDGDLEAAAARLRATWRSFAGRLGERHPDTLFCACNLAVTLRALDRAGQAHDLMQTSLFQLEQVIGAGHPHLDYPRRWRRINRDLEPQPV